MMPVWTSQLPKEELFKWASEVSTDLSTGGKVFGTKVGKIFKLEEFEEAITYAKTQATEGKAIIHPQE